MIFAVGAEVVNGSETEGDEEHDREELERRTSRDVVDDDGEGKFPSEGGASSRPLTTVKTSRVS